MPNHGKVTTRGHRLKPPRQASVTSNVEFQSVLRIRPLLKKEKEDVVILEPAKSKNKKEDVAVAVLHPMAQFASPDAKRKSGNLSSPKFIQEERQETYHFDKILSSSQDSVYYSLGLTMATNAMEPLKKTSSHTHNNTVYNHVALVMGVSNSGKTHTTFGDLKELGRPGRSQDDGLVPRILESLYSQSQHHVNHKKSFAVRMTLLHVENDQVHDLLLESTATSTTPVSSSAKKKSGVMAMVANFEGGGMSGTSTEITIDQDTATHDYVPNATVKTCWSSTEARQVLQGGLSRGLSTKFAGLTRGHSRGHTVITMQPVIIRGSRRDSTAVEKCGGTITFLDMAAGMERSHKTKSRSGAMMRDAIANNSCFSAVQHVLRTIKHNNDVSSGRVYAEIDVGGDEDTFDGSELSCVSEPKLPKTTPATIKPVPYRQSKVTMLLQPLFSNAAQWNLQDKKTTTVVTSMLTAYPGHRDYAEKKSLLNDLELLLGSDIAKRMKHVVNTGLDGSETPKQIHGNSATTLDDTSEETSSLEMSDDDDDDEEEEEEKEMEPPRARHAQSLASPPIAPSAPPIQAYDNDVLEPLPPPYAPGSQASLMEASAPPLDEVYPSVGAQAVSTPREASPVVAKPPASSQQRRTQVVDLPGVTLPSKSSTPVPSASASKKHRASPLSTRRTPTANSVSKTVPSPYYTSPPLSDTHRNKPTTTVMASISSTPNIQPPRSSNKENPSPSTTQKNSPSPSRHWKDSSPMKTISRAVHSSKKQGKRAIDKVDKIMDRTMTKRMSNEFEPKSDAPNDALLHRLKVLEKKNAKLTEANGILTEKCDRLTEENERLKLAAHSSKMQWRKDCWTMQDEQEWQHSKRIRMDEQDLIRGPLREHLENVQESYENSNQWMRPTKVPFSLQFPSHWQRATELDERDRAMQEGAKAPPTTPAVPQADTFAPPSSNQKRTQLNAFKKRLDMVDSKRYKHYDY